jgi:hypothetical protein
VAIFGLAADVPAETRFDNDSRYTLQAIDSSLYCAMTGACLTDDMHLAASIAKLFLVPETNHGSLPNTARPRSRTTLQAPGEGGLWICRPDASLRMRDHPVALSISGLLRGGTRPAASEWIRS